uniref:Trehalase n=1 Tax=Monochamus alternatus TaxID=192382 RepID=A0AA96NAJ2_MONAT|nr:trehalase-like protein 2 [Monochamus alternatus]
MRDTAKGMLENLLSLVKKYGFVPNGSRVYYLNRSQPPLLTLMVRIYIDATNDLKWLRKNVQTLDRELTWWLANRTVTVVKDGVNYTLARYGCHSTTPRPESYYEDLKTCREERCHIDIKSAAESGWDFSSRWIFDHKGGINATLSDIQTTRVIPVDLNAFLCKAFADLSYLYLKVGHTSKVTQWKEKADEWKNSILMVLYNLEDGIWYDYDLSLRQARKIFYPSNLTPLWAKAYVRRMLSDAEYGSRAVKYLKGQGVDKYKGGIPTSLTETGEQWDLPNAWPPIQEIVILGLRETGQKDAVQLAKEFSTRWIEANMKGFEENDNKMFEKYDAIKPGQYGGGGEYPVQTGFGWSNGVALSLINVYYTGDNL